MYVERECNRAGLDIGTVAIPAEQSFHGKGMPEIMHPWRQGCLCAHARRFTEHAEDLLDRRAQRRVPRKETMKLASRAFGQSSSRWRA